MRNIFVKTVLKIYYSTKLHEKSGIEPFHVVLKSLNKVDKLSKVYKTYCFPVVISLMVQSNKKAPREVAS